MIANIFTEINSPTVNNGDCIHLHDMSVLVFKIV